MIQYVQGDLLASDCGVLVHCCNCFCTFGSGIAKQIREQYPQAWLLDESTQRGDRRKLGTIRVVRDRDKIIVNLYGQYEYGRDKVHVDYTALARGLCELKTWALQQGEWPKIGMPRIGCGLAGGDWQLVSRILDVVFGEHVVHVYDFTPEGA